MSPIRLSSTTILFVDCIMLYFRMNRIISLSMVKIFVEKLACSNGFSNNYRLPCICMLAHNTILE